MENGEEQTAQAGEVRTMGLMEAFARVDHAISGPIKHGAREGVIPCPNCGKDLRWWLVAARTRGGRLAIRARCETPNCLIFMS